MAKFQWFDGNLGFYGYDQLTAYVADTRTTTGMVLEYDISGGALDPAHFAAAIQLTYSGYTSYIVEDGPDAGSERVTGGTLTGISYLDASGAVLLDISNLRVMLPIFLATLARGDAFSAWSMVTHFANSVTGSSDASGPGHAGTGDVIDTGHGADNVNALGGDDYIMDQGGVDGYSGGTGFDTVSYDGWYFQPQNVLRGLLVDLGLGTITGPDGFIDSVTGIDAVSGTFMADNFKGNAGANKFEGFGGADIFDGRGGFDMVSYGREAARGGTDGIRVNLLTGSVRDGFGKIDRVISIEGIEGTAVHDTFYDNVLDNYFNGAGGADAFHFGAGNDSAHGGAGADTFFFRGTSFGNDTIDDFSHADGDRVIIESATAFNQLIISTVVLDGKLAAFVQFGGSTLTMLGLSGTDLTAADFGF